MSINISLFGRMGRDVEIKQVANTHLAQVSVAVNHDRKNDTGEYETDWYRLNVWGNQAETFARLFSKGKRIMASGSLEINQYTTQSGEVRETRDVRVTDFKVVDWGDEQAPRQTQQQQQRKQTPDFGRDSDPFSGGTPMTLSDEDLPF